MSFRLTVRWGGWEAGRQLFDHELLPCPGKRPSRPAPPPPSPAMSVTPGSTVPPSSAGTDTSFSATAASGGSLVDQLLAADVVPARVCRPPLTRPNSKVGDESGRNHTGWCCWSVGTAMPRAPPKPWWRLWEVARESMAAVSEAQNEGSYKKA